MENAKKLKTNNCLRLMYVKEIIFEFTDEDHFITVGEITDILKNSYNITATRQTLYDDIEILIDAGYDIECVKGRNNKYHVLSREFDTAELHLLITSVESLKSLSKTQSKSLVTKVGRLAGPSCDYLLQNINVENWSRTDNNQVCYIIDAILDAIRKNRQIFFKYYKNINIYKKDLVNGGKEYQVSPYRVIRSGDFCYLIGYSEYHKKITAFRVDLICGSPKTKNRSRVPEPEDLYTNKCISGTPDNKQDTESSEVVLEFSNDVMSSMLDRFGQDMNITLVSTEKCKAKVHVEPDNAFFAWIFGFAGNARISGPSDIQNKYIRMVSMEMARL